MIWVFIVSWFILVLCLAIVIFGDEADFYRRAVNSKIYKKIYNLLCKLYGE